MRSYRDTGTLSFSNTLNLVHPSPSDQISNTERSRGNWSKLGLGTGTLASLGRAASASDVDRVLTAMVEIGAKIIDTADSYASGDCEILLGKAVRGKRHFFTLVTKAGYRLSNLPGPLRPLNQFVKKGIHRLGERQCFESSYLEKCLDHSLSRLQTDHVEAFLLHDPPLEAVTDDAVQNLCVKLRKSGKAILTGVSSENPETLRAAIASGVFSVIQTPANLNAAKSLRAIWQECEIRGIHVIGNHVYSPACLGHSGMNHEMLMRASAALLPADATILCGTRNPSHLHPANEWAHDPLTATEAKRLAVIAES